MAAAAKLRHEMMGATAIPLNESIGNLCNTTSMKTILKKIAPPHIQSIDDIKAREYNDLIQGAIHTAKGGSTETIGVFPIPVVIQLNSPLNFVSGEHVIVSTRDDASPTNQNMYTDEIFQIGQLNQDTESVTIDIIRRDGNITLDHIQNDDYKRITDVKWSDRRDATEPFRFTIPKTRCALVTRYKSKSESESKSESKSKSKQLVVVFGSTPAGAGGSRRKRVISRKLKSLNKKRKYTQRRFRRRYSYKGGRKN